jgi:hypothetical protein
LNLKDPHHLIQIQSVIVHSVLLLYEAYMTIMLELDLILPH